VTDPKAPKAPQLNLIAFDQGIADVIEDGIYDGFGLFLGEIQDLRHFVDNVSLCHYSDSNYCLGCPVVAFPDESPNKLAGRDKIVKYLAELGHFIAPRTKAPALLSHQVERCGEDRE